MVVIMVLGGLFNGLSNGSKNLGGFWLLNSLEFAGASLFNLKLEKILSDNFGVKGCLIGLAPYFKSSIKMLTTWEVESHELGPFGKLEILVDKE
ncbi:hypothetical protein SCA6_019997 [Theobroma cacao]